MWLILSLIFSPLVADLGDREWAVRNAADKRLHAAGWLALPALTWGVESPNPEVAERCRRLAERLPHLAPYLTRLIEQADSIPDLPPAVWLAVRPHVGRRADECVPLAVRSADGRRATLGENTTDWMTRQPYYAGTADGEVRMVLEAVKAKRRFLNEFVGPVAK